MDHQIPRGRIIYVAGQVAMDRSGKVVGEGEMRVQAQPTFQREELPWKQD